MSRILGIDPGSRITGFGVIDYAAGHATHVASGSIRVHGDDLAARLRVIFEAVAAVIAAHAPEEFAIERVFMHRNAASALKLGHARGAAIVAAVIAPLPIYEYTATQIKHATTGRGHAIKAQVQHMVKVLLCLPDEPLPDASDALAVALCHSHTRETLNRMPSAGTRSPVGRP